MHGMCMSMWCAKISASWVQPNPNLTTHNFQHIDTHLNAWNKVKMQMECNAWSYSIKNTTTNPTISQNTHQFSKTPKISMKPKT